MLGSNLVSGTQSRARRSFAGSLASRGSLGRSGPQILAAARGFVTDTGPRQTLKDLWREKKREILEVAARHGASNVRVFGSVARGDALPPLASDADFLVEFEPSRSLIDQGLLVEDLQKLLGCSVHVVEPKALHRVIRDEVLEEAVPL